MTDEFRPKSDPNDSASSTDPTIDRDPDATVGAPDPSAAPGEQPGTVIGRYKLIRSIGEGGFGTVFQAEQLEPVSRMVALKVIKLGMDTKQVIARFEAERQALAMMDHAGIAKVFDAGTTEAGRPYFVMELVQGIPITTYCDRNKLSTSRRLELFQQVCAAVQHAHQKGVIHRDIKPSNVLVSDTEGQPAPKVIDFGIAKATSRRLTEKTVFTQGAQLMGTPAYMSPEQADVTALDIDTRSDIYSLGVLLYELLAGATPFDNKKLLSGGYGEIQRIIREEDPPWPSTRAGGLGDLLAETAEHRRLRGPQLVKNLKGELDWIVMKCLEKDRVRRYETANGLARDVERFLGNEPVAASPPSRTYRLKKLIVRNRGVFAAGLAMALLLTSGVVGTSVGLVRAKQAEREAVSAATKSDQVAGFLTEMLTGVGPSAARGRDTEMLEEILQETHEKLGEELADQPEVEGEIRSYLGTTYFDLGQYEKAKEQFQRALELLQGAHGEVHLDVAKQHSNLGLAYEALAEFKESEKHHHQGLALRKELFGPRHEEVANNQVMLANLLVNDARYAEAEPLFLEAIDVLREVKGPNDSDVAICLNSTGNLMQHLGRFDEAGPYYEEALAAHRASLGADHPFVITDMVNLGWLAFNLSRFDTASVRFSEAGALARRVYGDSHPRLMEVIKAQGRSEQRLGNFEQAEALYREAWDMAIAEYGADHLNTADVMNDFATCLTEMHKLEEADELTQRVLEIQKAQLGEHHPTTVTTLHNIAYAVYTRAEFAEAIGLFRKSLQSYTAAYGKEHKHTSLVYNNLGRALRENGQLDEAVECFEEARGIRTRVLGEESLMATVSKHDLGKTRHAQGMLDEAAALFEEAITGYIALLDSTHRIVGLAMLDLAGTEMERGEFARALELAEQSRAYTAEALGEDHSAVVSHDVKAAAALSKMGALAEAEARFADLAPRLAECRPRNRAVMSVEVGRHQTATGRFAEAEQTLKASYEYFGERSGDEHHLTRKIVGALVGLYEAKDAAGATDAAGEAERWRRKLGNR